MVGMTFLSFPSRSLVQLLCNLCTYSWFIVTIGTCLISLLHVHTTWKIHEKKKNRICHRRIFPSCLSPSLFSLCLLRPPPVLPLPLGCYISWSGEELSLCFCSNWMRWAELCQCPHHLLLGRVQEEGGEGYGEGKKGARENGVLPPPATLIRQRRRPLSQYSQKRQHQGGSVWHTGKVIMTVGVSLEWTNHCFTWLNGDVQKRHGLGEEQSLSVALSSKGRWKQSREFIGLKCSIYMYANNWTQ